MDKPYTYSDDTGDKMAVTDDIYMKRALELADMAAAEGEVPVGAVVVRKGDGRIVGEGRNRREKSRSPLAHAELEAIQNAALYLGGWRLSGCDMYVTLEPCPMCTGGIINSRIDRVIYGAYDKKAGSLGSVTDLSALPYNHRPEITGGYMENECAQVLKIFFKRMRSDRMEGIKLVKAETDDQLRRAADIADSIWHEYFPKILSPEQIDFMVEKFCSFEAEKENLKEGYEYYFIKKGGNDVGYTAIKPDGDRLFLSKLYLKKEERGKKYARKALEQLIDIARERSLRAIWLTVNKYNDTTIAAYKAMGFVTIGDGVTDIGNGFVMDDYFMELDLREEK